MMADVACPPIRGAALHWEQDHLDAIHMAVTSDWVKVQCPDHEGQQADCSCTPGWHVAGWRNGYTASYCTLCGWFRWEAYQP